MEATNKLKKVLKGQSSKYSSAKNAKFEEASKQFDALIQRGLISKRGNMLADRVQSKQMTITFNR